MVSHVCSNNQAFFLCLLTYFFYSQYFFLQTVLREGKEITLRVPTVAMLGTDTNRIVAWAGALIQMPYKAVLEQVSNVPQGVYVSCTLYGSPASTALRPGVWITEVDGIPISNLDEFLDAVHFHEHKVVRSRQGSLCEVALKRMSLGNYGNKRLSATITQHNHLAAHPQGVPAEGAPLVAPVPVTGDGCHPHDIVSPGSLSHSPPNTEMSSSPTIPSEDAAQSAGYIRLKTVSRAQAVKVIAMKLDPIYWETWQLLPNSNPDSVSGWIAEDVK